MSSPFKKGDRVRAKDDYGSWFKAGDEFEVLGENGSTYVVIFSEHMKARGGFMAFYFELVSDGLFVVLSPNLAIGKNATIFKTRAEAETEAAKRLLNPNNTHSKGLTYGVYELVHRSSVQVEVEPKLIVTPVEVQ